MLPGENEAPVKNYAAQLTEAGYTVAGDEDGSMEATSKDWDVNFHSSMEGEKNLSLRVARQSHIHWLDCLIAFLKDPSDKQHPHKINTYGQFGRWYHSSGFARYGAVPEFQEIASLYDTFCLLSDELITLANDGGRKTACERLPELHILQGQLLAQIQKLIDTLEIKV